MTTLEILKRGRERVAKGWCKFAAALDAYGHLTCASGPYAVAWCMIGAVGIGDAATRLIEVTGAREGQLSRWNDAPGRTQAEVVAAFDRAIEREEARTR